MRDDIKGGLRNALDRGATLEQAMNSMISAGYTPQEVREAAVFFTDNSAYSRAMPAKESPTFKQLAAYAAPAVGQQKRPNFFQFLTKIPRHILILGIVLLMLVIALIITLVLLQ